jgi:hypothetical protein
MDSFGLLILFFVIESTLADRDRLSVVSRVLHSNRQGPEKRQRASR